MGVKMSEALNDHIRKKRIRDIFHSKPDAEMIFHARSMTFLRKFARAPDNHPHKKLIFARIPNPRPKSGVLTTNKKALVRGQGKLTPEHMTEKISKKCKTTHKTVTITRINPDSNLELWLPIKTGFFQTYHKVFWREQKSRPDRPNFF